MIIIKGDLILKEDTTYSESITVKGDIKGYYNLKVAGNIIAWNIIAWNINAGNINAGNIIAWNIIAGDIDAWNINAGNINARDIICEKRIKKTKTCKTISRIFVQGKFELERKEQMP
jgi:hypothetical protein